MTVKGGGGVNPYGQPERKKTIFLRLPHWGMFEMIYRTGATNNQPQVQIQIHHQHWSPTPPAKFGEFGWIKLSEEGNLKWQD